MTSKLLKLLDWLQQWEFTQIDMESTGEYWRPLFNILKVDFLVMLVNASHIKV